MSETAAWDSDILCGCQVCLHLLVQLMLSWEKDGDGPRAWAPGIYVEDLHVAPDPALVWSSGV